MSHYESIFYGLIEQAMTSQIREIQFLLLQYKNFSITYVRYRTYEEINLAYTFNY